MKNLLTISFIFIAFNYSFTQELLPNTKGEESLIGKINSQMVLKNISFSVKIFLNEKEINMEELMALNELRLSDFIELKFINIEEAKTKYGENFNGGVVIIKPFIDETLSKEYYESINNIYILEIIEKLILEGKIDSNPILVLNGIPLRGEDISNKINQLKKDDIKSVNHLDKKVGYKIYGVRAIPGVIIINLK